MLVAVAGALAFHGIGRAEPSAPRPAPSPALQILILPDGDRLTGQLVRRDGDTLIFASRHVGEVRASARTARLEPLTRPAESVATTSVKPPAPAAAAHEAPRVALRSKPARDSSTPWWRAPSAIGDQVAGFLGPWKGRFALALALTQDGAGSGETYGVDLSFSRKWTHDEARFDTHYYFSQVDGLVKTDLFKGSGIIRHDFRGPVFVSYRPTVEWNRNHVIAGEDADYVLGQHAIGIGVNLIDTPSRKLRLGVAENVNHLWTLDTDEHSTRDSQSLFGEVELELPWRVSVRARGTWFYTVATGDSGWEDQLEVTKKFTDTLSLGLRREARQNNPDPRIADYSLLRFQVGLDF